jgi:hypothetical protein
LLILALALGPPARADVEATAEPLPKQSYLRLAPTYVIGGDGAVTGRGVLVYSGLGWPGLLADDAVTGLRVDMPYKHGFGPVELLAVTGYHRGRDGFGIGIAADTSIEAGPAGFAQAIFRNEIELSFVVRELFGRGAITKLKPSLVVELPEDWFLSSDGELTIDDATTVPVNLRIGRSFGEHWVISGGPEVVVFGTTRGDVSLGVDLDYVP